MQEKSQMIRNIERFKGVMDIRGIGIQVLRMNQGPEYASKEIQDYLKVNGIIHNPTGRAEHEKCMLPREWIEIWQKRLEK